MNGSMRHDDGAHFASIWMERRGGFAWFFAGRYTVENHDLPFIVDDR